VLAYNSSGSSPFSNTIAVTTLMGSASSGAALSDKLARSFDAQSFDPLLIDAVDSTAIHDAAPQDIFREMDLVIYPNPVLDNTMVKITGDENAAFRNRDLLIRLVDFRGNEYMRQTIRATDSENIIPLDFGNYPRGSYFIQVISGNQSKSFKIEYSGRN
jgi:hypothetical protein